jgi:uncharacterized protein (TIGR03083 family)
MDLTVADFRALIQAEGESLLAQLARLSDDDWARPSPCAGWDVLDVAVHLQLGTLVHTRMVENARAGRMESPWPLPEGVDARAYFQQLHQETHDAGPAANLALLRERIPGYVAALDGASEADLARPAWFYGLPADLRRVVSAYTNDLIVHASDVRRPLGLEPAFSPAGARFAGQATLGFLPMFTSAERLGGASGVVRQTIDGLVSSVTLGPGGVQVTAAALSGSSSADQPAGPSEGAPADRPTARVGELAVDGGTWALLVWRQVSPAEAEQQGRLRIAGDRALVETYLAAIKTP